MDWFTRIFFMMQLFFWAGCFTSDKSAAVRPHAQRICRCAQAAQTDWTGRDLGRVRKAGGEISILIDSEPGILLSMYAAQPAVAQIMDHTVLEALVMLNAHTGETVPELASFWELSKDETTYTFHLLDNALWHDDQPFTADDVVFTFKQMLDPAGGALLRSRFDDVANVEALDRYTVMFELDAPRTDFLADVSKVMILPEHLLRNTTIVSNEFTRAPIGTGPFVFSEWKAGQYIAIVRKAGGWRAAAPALSRVVYKIVPKGRDALEMFKSGALDVVPDVSGVIPDDAIAVDLPQNQINGWVFHTGTPFFSDAQTRRAISMLIDRNAIACSIMNCLAKPAFSPWPDLEPNAQMLAFDPKKARALLKSAGWRDADQNGVLERAGVPFSFSLLLPDTDISGNRAVAVIVHDLRKAGIEVAVTVVSWAVYTDRLRRHQFEASVVSVSTAPPFTAKELFHSDAITSGRNFGTFTDNEIDDWFDTLQSEPDVRIQQTLRQKISDRLLLLQPVAFTVSPFQRIFVRKNMYGIQTGSSGIEVRSLWLDRHTEGAQ